MSTYFVNFSNFLLLMISSFTGSSLLLCGLSLVAASGSYSLSWASHCGGFSCCRALALGKRASVVAVRGVSSCGLVTPRHVGSSWTKD